jgi:ABC-2 type transport system ATP-binding protein
VDVAISTQGLTKHYGATVALVDLDLEVQRGEVFGYLGPNGAGKSTTIRLLLDLIRPTSGRAHVLGLDSRADAIEIRKRVGYLPGELALYENLTTQQLLGLFAELRGGVAGEYVRELAERLDLDLSRRIGNLSRGNKQKVGLVQAFMHRPEVVVLDEPTSGLDPIVQHEFHVIVEEVAAAGQTVFLSSHVLSEVEAIAHRVGIIRAGRLVVVENVHELKSKAVRRIEFHFANQVPNEVFDGVTGVRDVYVADRVARVTVDGPVDALVKAASRFEVVDLVSHEPDLEEVFLTYYKDGHGDS